MYTGWNMKSVVKLATILLSSSRLPRTVNGTAANKNHLICWRSSPLAWRSLSMTEKSATRILVDSSVMPKTRYSEENVRRQLAVDYSHDCERVLHVCVAEQNTRHEGNP